MATPTTRSLRRLLAAAVPLALAVAVTGCGLGDEPVDKGSLAKDVSLDGVELTVGSKEFTEQLVLCSITSLALKSAEAAVTEKCGMSGSDTVRTALESNAIDIYWEYTGTAWISFLKETKPLTDSKEQYDAVAKADKEKNDIAWLDRAPLNNTYAIAVKQGTGDELGVETISDYAKLLDSDPDAATLCVATEFVKRDDGLPGLEKAYGFTVPKDKLKQLKDGAIYNAVDKGDPCVFGEVFATDGRIGALNLTVLEDDKKFFPVYNPAPTLPVSVLKDNPDIAKVLNPIAAALDNETMQRLNAEVDVEGRSAEQVAEAWLKSQDFIG
ncbi:MAG: glycine/betaine ABC transporter substrate-binding protein [Micromonosporaceae bacterium]|nr:glycine/betaine ABC transporter substrate-binding protein [Micromonosporaceae bacterium]